MADSIDIPSILQQIGITDLGKQMLQILNLTGKMPEITKSVKELDAETLGDYDTSTNKIRLSDALDPSWSSHNKKAATVTAHELYHAVSNAMGDTVYERGGNFPKAIAKEYDKFSTSEGEKEISKLIKATDDSNYRASWPERNAFGVGNIIGRQLKSKESRPVSHADSTAATENAIKMDLFLRGLNLMKQGK